MFQAIIVCKMICNKKNVLHIKEHHVVVSVSLSGYELRLMNSLGSSTTKSVFSYPAFRWTIIHFKYQVISGCISLNVNFLTIIQQFEHVAVLYNIIFI